MCPAQHCCIPRAEEMLAEQTNMTPENPILTLHRNFCRSRLPTHASTSTHYCLCNTNSNPFEIRPRVQQQSGSGWKGLEMVSDTASPFYSSALCQWVQREGMLSAWCSALLPLHGPEVILGPQSPGASRANSMSTRSGLLPRGVNLEDPYSLSGGRAPSSRNCI